MSDRELLELAAKAAGLEIMSWQREPDKDAHHDSPFTREHGFWNPLTDDGDALRLAVKLKIDLDFFPSIGEVHTFCAEDGGGTAPHECLGTDHYAATRRAIVRAAAEVGKGLLSHDEFVLMFPGRFEPEEVERVRAAAAIGASMAGAAEGGGKP